jgi:YD repeat-containing protein
LFERLEARVVLNGAPVAVDDPWYSTGTGSTLTVGSSDQTLLDNDWDPEGNSLTASVVANPSNGSLTTFNSDGTFTYSPNSSFSGVDSFTYKANDGSVDSNVVTVSIAIGGDFGVRTNLEEAARDATLLTGGLQLVQALTPEVSLVYQSNTLPKPIVAVETSLLSSSMTPDSIDAKLTFNGSAGTTYNYDTTSLSPGDSLRFALQNDASSLATGYYDYSVDLTFNSTLGNSTRTFTGSQAVVNRGGSTNPFGRGWQLAGLEELVVNTNGALLVQADGDGLWFEGNGSGGYLAAEGDTSFSSLVKNGNDTYTLTGKQGGVLNFDTAGKLTSRVDRNSNTVSYVYTSGLLTKITDPFSRDTTFTYTSGQLTSVTDIAGRTATLIYDTSGRLTSVTQPDPDGAGSQAAPVTSFEYDATTNRLTKSTDALSQATQYAYGSHGRLTQITRPDNATWKLTSLQTIGLPTGTSGNSLTSANPTGSVTNERGKVSSFRTDRFGNAIELNNELNYQTLTERNGAGQVVRLTQADPDGSGALTSPVTTFGFDANGNRVYQQNPDASTKTWTYTTAFNQIASATDELSRVQSFSYDTSGNLTTSTDGAGYSTTYVYNSQGLPTSITTPDPDAGGALTAAVTSLAYDAYGRLVTQTNADSSTRTFAYDSAGNRTSETDELGNAATFVFDSLNRMTSATDREGATTSFVFDAIGQLVKQTDSLSNVTDYVYNNRGFQTKVTRPDPDGTGPLSRPESTYQYNATGQVTQIGEWSMGGATQPITCARPNCGRTFCRIMAV